MRVKFVADHEVRISKLSTRVFRAEWEGDVDDKVAEDAIRRKAAVAVKPEPETKPEPSTDTGGQGDEQPGAAGVQEGKAGKGKK